MPVVQPSVLAYPPGVIGVQYGPTVAPVLAFHVLRGSLKVAYCAVYARRSGTANFHKI